jgi:hypothetical protein
MGNSDKYTKEFFKMAHEDPDLFIKIASDMVNSNENVLTDPMFRLCRGIAFGMKGAKKYLIIKKYDDEILELYEKSLLEFGKFFKLSPEDMPPKPYLEKKIDAIGISLEPLKPGRVQELLGFTKLKYLVYGEKVSINEDCEENLIPTEDDQRHFGEILFSAPFIVKSALVMFCTNDDDGKRYMNVALFEDEAISEPTGEVSLYEDGSYKTELFNN